VLSFSVKQPLKPWEFTMFRFLTALFAGVFTVALIGCGPEPVVVDPDADDDTTVIERDVEVVEPAAPANDAGTGVQVDVGGGEGVDVKVDSDNTPDANPNQ
jgi:hypothetical protein